MDYIEQRDVTIGFLVEEVDDTSRYSNTTRIMATASAWKILQQGYEIIRILVLYFCRTKRVPPSIPYGSVKKWGAKLVHSACSSSSNVASVKKAAVSILSDVLYSAAVQMRECVLNLQRSEEVETGKLSSFSSCYANPLQISI